MNAEFKRNLWLELSAQRILMTATVLGLIFWLVSAVQSPTPAENVRNAASLLFIAVVWLWGGRQAGCSISDELRDKTWDQQRMSAMRPWPMTWGKLWGATALSWCGGAICLVVMLAAGWQDEQANVVGEAALLVVGAVLIHSLILAATIHVSRGHPSWVQRGLLLWVLLIVGAGVVISVLVQLPSGSTPWVWYGYTFERESLLLGSMLLFAACGVFASYRAMSNALSIRTIVWAWPLLALILAVYSTGFVDPARGWAAILSRLSMAGLFISAAMSYLALFSDPHGVMLWKKILVHVKSADLRGALEHLPLWPSTMVLCFVFALAAWVSPLEPVPDGWEGAPLVVALRLLRDASVFTFFSFSPKARWVVGSTLVTLFVLAIALPQAFSITGLMATEAAIAMGLVAWRWRKMQIKNR